jgi:hypothetical protein
MERHASSLMGKIAHDPASRRLLQTVVCLGALASAGALTLETRIGAASVRPTPSGLTLQPAPTGVRPADAASIEARARATAQKALAEALVKAKTNSARAAAIPGIDAPKAPLALRAASNTAPAAPRRTLSDADLKLLADKAAQALKAGDIGGARMVLERAAAAGDATAVFALGETYDPNVLTKMRVRGLEGDVAQAKELYLKASEQGVARARERLDELSTADTASAE